MCVIEKKTYLYPNNRRGTVENVHRCHRALTGPLCEHVQHKEISAARVVEMRPSPERASSAKDILTTDNAGRERRYRTLGRTLSKRSTPSQSTTRSQSPNDRPVLNAGGATSPYRNVRPPAPSPPPAEASPARGSRRVSFHEQLDDGSAVYRNPPSLGLPRAFDNERPFLDRQSSMSSLTNEVDDAPLPRRRSSVKVHRRTNPLNINLAPSSTASSSPSSSPGLSSLPRFDRTRQDSAADLHYRSGVDSAQDSHEEEDDRQARIMRETLAGTDRRQRARLSKQRLNEDLFQQASREHEERSRRDDSAGVSDEQAARGRRKDLEREREREVERKLQAEMDQIEREKAAAEERKRYEHYSTSATGHPSPISARAYKSFPSPTLPPATTRPLLSARTYSETSPTLAARTPRQYNVQIHNPPFASSSSTTTASRRDFLAEQGERVIAMAQHSRAGDDGSCGLSERMNRMELKVSGSEDEELDAIIESGIGGLASRKYRGEERRKRRSDMYNY